MKFFSYGITTSRYASSLIWNETKLLTPVGSTLCLWDLQTLKREKVLECNNNAIMVVLQNSHYIFAISYNGEITIFDRKDLRLMGNEYRAEGRCVRHASVNDNYLAISAEEGPNNCKGVITVFDVKLYYTSQKWKPFNKVFTLQGRYRFCHLFENRILFVTRENILNHAERQEWKELQKITPTLRKEDKPKKRYNYDLLTFDIQSQKETSKRLLEHVSDITCSTSNNIDYVNLMYLDRKLLVLNGITLETVVDTNVAGSGAILAVEMYGRNTYLSPKPGVLLDIDLDKVKNFPKILDTDKDKIDSVVTYKIPGSGIDSKMYCFLFQNEETGVVCFEDGINTINLKTKKVKDVSCFNITCCGIALSNNGELIATGDFLGHVKLFPTEKTLSMEPLAETFIMEPIRTLTFDSRNESILIGTLSGKLLRWWIQDPSEPRIVATFKEGVLNIRYNYHKNGDNYLLVGLVDGMFAVLKEVELEHNMLFTLAFYAHLPSELPHNHNFGSLHKFAEIWSTVWSATSNDFLVTASEDQTCCVWDISKKNAVLVHKLEGHTRAVTSIDWRVMDPALGERFISCSDDQTARVYDPKDNFKLLFELSTSFIKEWHTLTYLSLEEGGTRVAIGSQNGFLFVYDLFEKEFLFSERIHNGSIEGLDWKGDTIVTCSADNSVSVVQVKKHVPIQMRPPKIQS